MWCFSVGIYSPSVAATNNQWMTGVLMMQFIISPKHSTRGATNNRFDSRFSLSAFQPVSLYPPTQHSSIHLLSTIGFGTFHQFHHWVFSKWRLQSSSFWGRGWNDPRECFGKEKVFKVQGCLIKLSFSDVEKITTVCAIIRVGVCQYVAARLQHETAPWNDDCRRW